MFGMGMGEIVLIAVVALLVLGPDRLPGAAKAIGKGIRDLRKQTRDLQRTVEDDTELGEAVRDLRSALRGDPEELYRRATGTPWKSPPPAPEEASATPLQGFDHDGNPIDTESLRVDSFGRALDESGAPLQDQLASVLGEGGERPEAGDESVPNHPAERGDATQARDGDDEPSTAVPESTGDPDIPVLRTPDGAVSRDGRKSSSDG